MARTVAVLALLLLAGCAAPDQPDADPEATPENPAEAGPDHPSEDERASTEVFSLVAGSETTTWTDTIDLTLRWGVPFAPWDQQDVRQFEVETNHTAMLVEVAWDDPAMDLDAYAQPLNCDLQSPCNAERVVREGQFHTAPGGMPGQGDSPSRLFIDAAMLHDGCDECPWYAGGLTETAAAQVTATIYVTLFTAEVPAGFTAIPQA